MLPRVAAQVRTPSSAMRDAYLYPTAAGTSSGANDASEPARSRSDAVVGARPQLTARLRRRVSWAGVIIWCIARFARARSQYDPLLPV
jgi:hypothetical protein